MNSIFINGIMDIDLHCSKIHLRGGRTSIDASCTQSAVFCGTRCSRGRNYEEELQKRRPDAILVEFGEYHPLKPIMVLCLSLSWSPDLIANITNILSIRAISPHTTLQMRLHPLIIWSIFLLSLGDWHKNPPWGPQRKYILFLFLVLCAHRSTKLHARWDRSPVHVCSSISQWCS